MRRTGPHLGPHKPDTSMVHVSDEDNVRVYTHDEVSIRLSHRDLRRLVIARTDFPDEGVIFPSKRANALSSLLRRIMDYTKPSTSEYTAWMTLDEVGFDGRGPVPNGATVQIEQGATQAVLCGRGTFSLDEDGCTTAVWATFPIWRAVCADLRQLQPVEPGPVVQRLMDLQVLTLTWERLAEAADQEKAAEAHLASLSETLQHPREV